MTTCTEETYRLLRLAERDLLTFGILASHPEAALSAICFHARQCAEKALKAALTIRCVLFPRTHNRKELATPVSDQGIVLPLPARELRGLNPYAVEFRYDDETIPLINREEAAEIVTTTLEWARRTVTVASRS